MAMAAIYGRLHDGSGVPGIAHHLPGRKTAGIQLIRLVYERDAHAIGELAFAIKTGKADTLERFVTEEFHFRREKVTLRALFA